MAWRWIYVVMEDDQGDRHVAGFEVFKVAKKAKTFSLTTTVDPRQTLFVLPKGTPE